MRDSWSKSDCYLLIFSYSYSLNINTIELFKSQGVFWVLHNFNFTFKCLIWSNTYSLSISSATSSSFYFIARSFWSLLLIVCCKYIFGVGFYNCFIYHYLFFNCSSREFCCSSIFKRLNDLIGIILGFDKIGLNYFYSL